jgi:hypothetical protein
MILPVLVISQALSGIKIWLSNFSHNAVAGTKIVLIGIFFGLLCPKEHISDYLFGNIELEEMLFSLI